MMYKRSSQKYPRLFSSSSFFVCSIIFLISFSLFLFSSSASAETVDELQANIDARNAKIDQLQKEIDGYNAQVTAVGTQAKTLQNNIKTLDLTNKKLNTSLILTDQKIKKTDQTIGQLATTISTTTDHISLNKKTIAELIKTIYQEESNSIIVKFFSHKTFSELWDEAEKTKQFQHTIQSKSNELVDLTVQLSDKKTAQEIEKKKMADLEQQLEDQKKIVAQTTAEKALLLSQTKQQEATYKQILAQKKAEQAQFEKELFDYESKLKLITDPSQIPTARHSILAWPLESVYITQQFGVTNASARLYVSGSHNGVDFRAAIGTKVLAVKEGTVVGTGNTDQYPGCYSFGKWVMIKHDNGLSTIYGHLSLIKVNKGDTVSTGDVIGLSGYSGYVAPPGPAGAHLHLGVYATAGVEIKQFVQSRGCKQATLPIADTRAYLDPLLYLPLQ